MSEHASPGSVVAVGEGFWNIRGSFRVAKIVEAGTQASLVRRASGRFVMLDCCQMPEPVVREVAQLTNGGADIEAIVNLHPFHTMHVRAVHARYPHAKLYGTSRHVARFPDLPWQKTKTEDPEMAKLLADDLELSVPRGVDFISSNENVHFASVLAFHRASATIHVDDTLNYIHVSALRVFGLGDAVRFHPTLARVLERRAGAVRDFRAWFEALVDAWGDATNLCAAHMGPLLGDAPLRPRLRDALTRVDRTLATHERKHG